MVTRTRPDNMDVHIIISTMQSQKNATRESGGNECEIAWQATGIVGKRKA